MKTIRQKWGTIALYAKKYSLSDTLNQITEENKQNLEWDDKDIRAIEEW